MTRTELETRQADLNTQLAAAKKAKRSTAGIKAQLQEVQADLDALALEETSTPEVEITVVVSKDEDPPVEVVEPTEVVTKKERGLKPSTLGLVEQRKPSWSTLATTFDIGVSAAEAIQAANIQDTIVKAPMFVQLDNGDFLEVAGKFAMVDPMTGKFFGPASAEYSFLQNSELAQMLDSYITKQFPVVACGTTPDGSGVMFLLDAGERMVAGEKVHQYFLVAESRTVGISFKQAFTPLRFICMNTMMTAFKQAFSVMSARHDRNFRISLGDSINFVNHAHIQAQQTMSLFDTMATRQISSDNLELMTELAFPSYSRASLDALEATFGENPTEEYAQKRVAKARKAYNYWTARSQAMRDLTVQRFENFETDNPALQGTIYAAYNSVVEVEDFGIFKGSFDTTVARDSIFGTRADGKVRAMNFAESLLLV